MNEAKATLEADRAARTAKQSEIEADKNTKADLAYQVGEKLNSIVDIEDLLDEIERLSENVDDVLQVNQDLEKERGEEEEKFLDTHSTLRILQDAAARHDLDILDTIATKREEKV